MGVRVVYDGPWNGGRIHVEAESVSELTRTVRELQKSLLKTASEGVVGVNQGEVAFPHISGNLGCADAIRTILSGEWGRTEARTEGELTAAMKANAIHYSHGTVSGLLTSMTRRGDIRRVGKKDGAYAYVIRQSGEPD